MKKLYLNGNYLVSFDDRYSGSRTYTALRRNEDFIPDFPDSWYENCKQLFQKE